MKILVTGSQGTIGLPLYRELKLAGHQVYGCDLVHTLLTTYERCDISEYRQIERLFDNGIHFDLVFHLAAEFGRWNGEDYYEQLWKTNVIGTRNILEMQKHYGFKLVFTSSSEIYNGIDEGVLREDLLPEMQRNDYSITKWVNEIQCRNFRLKYGLPIMIFRLFNIYGPGEYYTKYRSVVAQFCYKALHKEKYIVYKNCSRTFLYIDDLISTFLKVPDKFYDGEVINLSGDETTNIKDLSDTILHLLGMPDDLVIYKDSEEFNVNHKHPSNDKAQNLFVHSPKIKLEEGLKFTLEWMRKVYDNC